MVAAVGGGVVHSHLGDVECRACFSGMAVFMYHQWRVNDLRRVVERLAEQLETLRGQLP
jgi:hypothetical protein